MRVFVTGATGFIGSRVTAELIAAGHEVIGSARSDAGAEQLARMGAGVHRGTLEQPDTLAAGAASADAVIHTAFDHDFSRYIENCEKDARVIEALGAVLAGSSRPLIVTSGVGVGRAGTDGLAREDEIDREHVTPRHHSEFAAEKTVEQGVSAAVVRLGQVHDTRRQGLISPFIEHACRTGRSAYIGNGDSRMAAGHVDDVARLYRLALEHHETGACWHAVAEEGVPMHEIAHVIGAGLDVPVVSLAPTDANTHFGWLALFADMNLAASSAATRDRLGWQPSGPTLIEDLRAMDYREVAKD